jgi:hypothetical protein
LRGDSHRHFKLNDVGTPTNNIMLYAMSDGTLIAMTMGAW